MYVWKSTWNSEVRKAIRRGSAEEEVRKHRDRVTRAWQQISKQRQRGDISYDPSMVTALQHGTKMDEEGFKKTCIRKIKKRGGIHWHQPFYGTWVADFMLRQDAGIDCQCSHLGPLALFCTADTLLIASCLFWSEIWLLAYFLPLPSPIVSYDAMVFFSHSDTSPA